MCILDNGVMGAEAAAIRRLLSSRIIELRRKANLTQEELARAAGVGLDAVGRLERGEVTPSLETLQSIAGVFQQTLDELFTFEERRTSTPLREEIDQLSLFLATRPVADVRYLANLVRSVADYLDQDRQQS